MLKEMEQSSLGFIVSISPQAFFMQKIAVL